MYTKLIGPYISFSSIFGKSIPLRLGKILAYTQSTHRVATAGIHSMMEKLDLSGEGGGCTPTIFTIIYKLQYTLQLRREILKCTPPYFISILMYSVSLHLKYVPICSGF